MSTFKRSILFTLAMLLCFKAARLPAQDATAKESRCFSIHVNLDGKPLDGPQVIALRTEHNESTAALEGGCFQVPPALLAEKQLDVSFTVARNQIELVHIATGFFTGPWDIELQDKKTGKDVPLPKHAVAKDACTVVFHVGEPETAMMQTGCRKSLSDAPAATRRGR